MKMAYVRAADVLPAWLLWMVQEYAAETCLYILQEMGRVNGFRELVHRPEQADIRILQKTISAQGNLTEILSEREVGLQDHPAGKKICKD